MQSYTFSVRVDQQRNVMYISQKGRPTAHDFKLLKASFLDEIGSLEPGFAIVNDQRFLLPFDEEAMTVAEELVELTNKHGVSKVIRILPADLISKTQISRTLVSARSRYQTIRVSSPEEAEAALIDE